MPEALATFQNSPHLRNIEDHTQIVYVVYGSSLTLPVPTGKMPLAPAGPNVEDRDSVLKSKQVIRTHTEC